MKASIVKIGNSRGIRIPKAVFDHCDFNNEVDMEIRNNELVIRAVHKPRTKWARAFQTMAERGDDVLVDKIAGADSSWDNTQW
ncbi:MAG: AbrB/MazE/SpoVT family DNA-binding domain-containing protein, partial [Verrucomicrobiales bacterium]